MLQTRACVDCATPVTKAATRCRSCRSKMLYRNGKLALDSLKGNAVRKERAKAKWEKSKCANCGVQVRIGSTWCRHCLCLINAEKRKLPENHCRTCGMPIDRRAKHCHTCEIKERHAQGMYLSERLRRKLERRADRLDHHKESQRRYYLKYKLARPKKVRRKARSQEKLQPVPELYPFGADDTLIVAVSQLVSSDLPEDIRQDICQEALLLALERKLDLSALPDLVREAQGKVFRESRYNGKQVSLEQKALLWNKDIDYVVQKLKRRTG